MSVPSRPPRPDAHLARCAVCGATKGDVIDSRAAGPNFLERRRRRRCWACGHRWTTIEREAPGLGDGPAFAARRGVPAVLVWSDGTHVDVGGTHRTAAERVAILRAAVAYYDAEERPA